MILDYTTLNERWLVNDDLDMIWKEGVEENFK